VSGATEFDPAPGTVDPSGNAVGSHTVSSTSGDDRSLGQIVGDLTNDLTTLVKQELALAKTELKEEAGKAGKGAGMLGGAGVAGLLAAILGSFALAYLLDNWMPVELAFLIVTLLWAVVAAVLAAKGKKELKNANPQLPETQQTLKEDAAWARAQKN
jgi:F0F1-type ATP synthase assembly protein I